MKKRKKRKQSPKSKPWAKPEAKPKKPATNKPSFRGALWLWFGAIGTTLTLFGGLQTLLDYAAWARWVVANWQQFIESFWGWAFHLVGVKLIPDRAGLLTFYISIIFIALGGMALEQRHEPRDFKKSVWNVLIDHDFHLRVSEGIAIAICSVMIFREALEWSVFGRHFDIWASEHRAVLLSSLGLALIVFSLIGIAVGLERLGHALLLTGLLSLFYVVISLPSAFRALSSGQVSIEAYRQEILEFSSLWLPSNIGVLLGWAQPKFINYRLAIVILTLLLILLLNYASLLGLSLRAPE